jgi:hypothetical protein
MSVQNAMGVVSWEIAAQVFPQDAKAIEATTGKARNRKRRKLRELTTITILREFGASCKNCPSFKIDYCEFHSDFYGKQSASPDGLCLDYHGEKTGVWNPS